MLRLRAGSSFLLAVVLIAPLRLNCQTAAEVEWIRKNAMPLTTTEPGQDTDDLQPLRKLIGDARIVAIGEGTHGSREFFRLRHRLIEFLARELGFTILAIEAQMGESWDIGEYVRGGAGNPGALLADLISFSVRNQETLDLIKWIRDFNTTRKTPLQFAGFDMLIARAAARYVESYLRRVDPKPAEKAGRIFSDAARARRTPFGVATASIPVTAAAGKTIRFSGHIRTLDVQHGYAGLWLQIDNKSGVHSLENMGKTGPRGTTPWKEYTIEASIPENATRIIFGMLHTGDGTAWFDSLRIEIDGSAWNMPGCDLDFESGSTETLSKAGDQYNLSVTVDTAFSGRRSFRMLYMDYEPPDPGPRVDLVKTAEELKAAIAAIESSKETYIGKSSESEFQRGLQSARITLQRVEERLGRTSRDRLMAENVRWIVGQAPPGTKIIIWAHNAHVARIKDWMGGYLNEWYGKEMVVIGTVCSRGRYVARDPKELRIGNLQLPPPGSVEHYLGSAGMPRFLIDFRRVSAGEAACQWLKGSLRSRMIGALIAESQFIPWPPAFDSLFDIMVYLAETTPATPLN